MNGAASQPMMMMMMMMKEINELISSTDKMG